MLLASFTYFCLFWVICDLTSYHYSVASQDKDTRSPFFDKNEFKINKKYFSKENNIYTFKEDIVFNKNRFSLNVQQFLEIFPLNQRKEMLKKIQIY